ncbi:MAG: tetratricopeptide repeat protein [Candidatus Altiarchaeota archaeon]
MVEYDVVFHCVLVAVVTSLAYSNIFQNEFVYDDYTFIVKWNATRSLGNIPSFFTGELPHGHSGVYRPVRGVFYAVGYWLWGVNPAGYHLQSLFVHLTCTILVYFIALEVAESGVIALMTAIVFGVHPVHTEAVTFMTASFDVIGVAFFLSSFLLYLRSGGDWRRVEYVFSAAFAVLAFLTYEVTLTLPLMIVLYDACFRKAKRRSVGGYWVKIPYFMLAAFYFLVRSLILELPRGQYFAGSFYYTMLTMSKAFVKYVSLTLFPVGLSLEHTLPGGISSHIDSNLMGVVFAQTILDSDVLFSMAVILTLVVIMVKCLRRYPIVSFCIGWFIIGLSPVSNIIPQPVVMAERYLYLPSFGFCLLFSWVVYQGFRKDKWLALVFVFVVLAYAGLTISRNYEWRDQMTLWSKTAERSPGSALPHLDLGIEYARHGMADAATEEFKKTLDINPDIAEAHNNLGIIYTKQGRVDLAVNEFKTAIKIKPELEEAHNNLGIIYVKQGMTDAAAEEFRRSIEITPDEAKTHIMLEEVYKMQGRANMSLREYENASEFYPENRV